MKYYKTDPTVTKQHCKTIFEDVPSLLSLPAETLQKLSTDKVTVVSAYL